MQLQERLARTEDWPRIEELLHGVVRWLQSKGSKQWSDVLGGNDAHNTKARIEQDQVYIVENETNDLVGVFILWDEQSPWDIDLWGREDTDEYAYLHRVAISRDYSGQSLGAPVVELAKKAAKENGKKAIRLDCRANLAPLNNLYQGTGFELVKVRKDYDSGDAVQDFNLYEYKF